MSLAVDGLDPHLRCLLLLARPRLAPVQIETLRGLLARPDCDHPRLVALAREHHIALLVQAHLGAHAPQALAGEAATSLARVCGLLRLRQMEQLRVQTEVLGVLDAQRAAHALLKGRAIGTRHYRDPLLRQCRDVDVLVDAGALAEATRGLLARGYVLINKVWPAVQPPCIDALVTYTTAVELSSPSGVTVELHRLLDHSACVFPPRRLLWQRGRIGMFGREVSVLAPDAEILYALFHHARHQWTLLHWLADLQAFVPSLRREDLQAQADRHGLRATLQAALELATQVDALALDPAGLERPSDFLAFALPHWHGTAGEHPGEREPDFRMSGQKSWRYRACFQVSRLRPTLDDYLGWPLPARWRWLYYLSKPARVLARGGRGGQAG